MLRSAAWWRRRRCGDRCGRPRRRAPSRGTPAQRGHVGSKRPCREIGPPGAAPAGRRRGRGSGSDPRRRRPCADATTSRPVKSRRHSARSRRGGAGVVVVHVAARRRRSRRPGPPARPGGRRRRHRRRRRPARPRRRGVDQRIGAPGRGSRAARRGRRGRGRRAPRRQRPRPASASTTWLPTKPAPPVTSTRIGLPSPRLMPIGRRTVKRQPPTGVASRRWRRGGPRPTLGDRPGRARRPGRPGCGRHRPGRRRRRPGPGRRRGCRRTRRRTEMRTPPSAAVRRSTRAASTTDASRRAGVWRMALSSTLRSTRVISGGGRARAPATATRPRASRPSGGRERPRRRRRRRPPARRSPPVRTSRRRVPAVDAGQLEEIVDRAGEPLGVEPDLSVVAGHRLPVVDDAVVECLGHGPDGGDAGCAGRGTPTPPVPAATARGRVPRRRRRPGVGQLGRARRPARRTRREPPRPAAAGMRRLSVASDARRWASSLTRCAPATTASPSRSAAPTDTDAAGGQHDEQRLQVVGRDEHGQRREHRADHGGQHGRAGHHQGLRTQRATTEAVQDEPHRRPTPPPRHRPAKPISTSVSFHAEPLVTAHQGGHGQAAPAIDRQRRPPAPPAPAGHGSNR